MLRESGARLSIILFFLFMGTPFCFAEPIFSHLEKPQLSGKELGFTYCRHTVKKGEWLAQIIRTYGYYRPFKAGYVKIAKNKNSQIKNINKLKEGDQVVIPIVYLKNKKHRVTSGSSCQSLLRLHQVQAFIIKGPIKKIRTIANENTTEEKQVLTESKKEREYSEFAFRIGGVFDSLHSKFSSETVFVSDLQPSLGFEWEQLWSKRWHSLLGANLNFKKYNETQLLNKSIANKSLNQSHLYFGLKYLWGELSYLKFTLGGHESMFYRQNTEDIYSLEKLQSLAYGLTLSQETFRYQLLSVSALGSLRYLTHDKFNFDDRWDYGLGLNMRHDISKKNSLGGTVFYRQGELKSNSIHFEQRWLELMLEYRIRF